MAYAPFDLTGKTVLVTGGNRGIGLGMAEAMAASGANLAIWGRGSEANAAAVDKLNTLGSGSAKAWTVDVGEEGAIIQAMTEVETHFGRIDSCFANAGMGFGSPSFAEMTTETWRKICLLYTSPSPRDRG